MNQTTNEQADSSLINELERDANKRLYARVSEYLRQSGATLTGQERTHMAKWQLAVLLGGASLWLALTMVGVQFFDVIPAPGLTDKSGIAMSLWVGILIAWCIFLGTAMFSTLVWPRRVKSLDLLANAGVRSRMPLDPNFLEYVKEGALSREPSLDHRIKKMLDEQAARPTISISGLMLSTIARVAVKKHVENLIKKEEGLHVIGD